MNSNPFDQLPSDMINLISNELSRRDRLALFSATKKLFNRSASDPFWQEMGAADYTDFMTKIEPILQYADDHKNNAYFNAIYNAVINMHSNKPIISLENAEILRKIEIAREQRTGKYEQYLTPGQIEKLNSILGSLTYEPTRIVKGSLIKFIVLSDKLLSADEIKKDFHNLFYNLTQSGMDDLTRVKFVTAIGEGLLTVAQAKAIEYKTLHILLDSKNGLDVLRKKLITPEQVAKISPNFLNTLLKSKNGLEVLRKKLITPEQAEAIGYDILVNLLNNENLLFIEALEKKLIPLEKINTVELSKLEILLDKNGDGITALEKGLINLDEVPYINHYNLPSMIYTSVHADELLLNDVKTHLLNFEGKGDAFKEAIKQIDTNPSISLDDISQYSSKISIANPYHQCNFSMKNL